MALDTFYRRCCLTGQANCKIEWHHNLIYAGKQVNEKWCILPLCSGMHSVASNKGVKKRLDWIMLNRATNDELKSYSKAVDLVAKKYRLNKEFGKWYPGIKINQI